MKSYPISYEYEGESCGEGQIESEFEDAARNDPEGAVFVCPVCARAWAKHTVAGRYFMVFTRRCREHDSGLYYDFAGSIWLDWNHCAIKALPRAVLERELMLHLERWDKFYQLELFNEPSSSE